MTYTDKKRHHYIPKAYLKFFCDDEGMVCVYPKDKPGEVFRQAPDSTGFHKYYYSQPMPEGGTDHNTLENLFSQLESKWPPIVERLKRREDVNDSLEDIFAFLGLQRVRVPASRDAMEKADAGMVWSCPVSVDGLALGLQAVIQRLRAGRGVGMAQLATAGRVQRPGRGRAAKKVKARTSDDGRRFRC